MKNTKIYIGILLPILVFLCNFTFAANEVSVSGFTQLFELGGNMLYIILWPLLVITGLALGNDLALGSVFGLDEVLYKFWLVMRNFASLTLVGIILYDIVAALWSGKVNDVVKKVWKYILAGILIPASWWFVPFLLSVSNLLITGVGELPLNFRDNIASTKVQKILTTHTYLNLADKVQTSEFFRFAAYYGNGSDYYMTCKFDRPTISPSTATVADPTKITPTYDAIYISVINAQAKSIKDVTISDKYCALDQHTLVDLSVLSPKQCQLLNKSDTNDDGWGGDLKTEPCLKFYEQDDKGNFSITKEYKTAVDNGYKVIKEGNSSMDDAGKNGSMVGSLYTIYASLMNFSTISASNDATMTDTKLIEHMVKLLVTAMAILPLVGLAIIAMVRVGVIWLLMAFSPFIALLNSLYGSSGADKADKTGFWGKGRVAKMSRSIGEIVKLILQPVIIVFGISLGLIFLTTIQFKLTDDSSGSLGFMGMEPGKPSNGFQSLNTQNISINVKTSATTSGDSMFFNLFHMLIMNIFGIIVMRQIWMMSMKFSSSSITKDITDQVTDYAQKYVGSRPIIPFPTQDGIKGVSWNGLKQGAGAAQKVITDKFFPDDKTYESSGLKGTVEDFKVRNSEAREKEEKNIRSATDGKVNAAANANMQPGSAAAAKEFADVFQGSQFGTGGDLKGGDVTKSEGVKYALNKFGFTSNIPGVSDMEYAVSNKDFAGAMFDSVGDKITEQFGTFKTGKALGAKALETMQKNRAVGENINNKNKKYYYQNKENDFNILMYNEEKKAFDEGSFSLPKQDKFATVTENGHTYTKLDKEDLDHLAEYRNKTGKDIINKPYTINVSVRDGDPYVIKTKDGVIETYKRNITDKKYEKQP